jgi:hypothetical protein
VTERARESARTHCPTPDRRSAPELGLRVVRSVVASVMAAPPSSKVPVRARGTGPLPRLNRPAQPRASPARGEHVNERAGLASGRSVRRGGLGSLRACPGSSQQRRPSALAVDSAGDGERRAPGAVPPAARSDQRLAGPGRLGAGARLVHPGLACPDAELGTRCRSVTPPWGSVRRASRAQKPGVVRRSPVQAPGYWACTGLLIPFVTGLFPSRRAARC